MVSASGRRVLRGAKSESFGGLRARLGGQDYCEILYLGWGRKGNGWMVEKLAGGAGGRLQGTLPMRGGVLWV